MRRCTHAPTASASASAFSRTACTVAESSARITSPSATMACCATWDAASAADTRACSPSTSLASLVTALVSSSLADSWCGADMTTAGSPRSAGASEGSTAPCGMCSARPSREVSRSSRPARASPASSKRASSSLVRAARRSSSAESAHACSCTTVRVDWSSATRASMTSRWEARRASSTAGEVVARSAAEDARGVRPDGGGVRAESRGVREGVWVGVRPPREVGPAAGGVEARRPAE
mmetsp:Transcript_13740/g.36812  ORF Transcript_13740/g.36812 Transcript_13740/m.36812 type:complete len:237 (-) Transcript_13740:380-1090(-)